MQINISQLVSIEQQVALSASLIAATHTASQCSELCRVLELLESELSQEGPDAEGGEWVTRLRGCWLDVAKKVAELKPRSLMPMLERRVLRVDGESMHLLYQYLCGQPRLQLLSFEFGLTYEPAETQKAIVQQLLDIPDLVAIDKGLALLIIRQNLLAGFTKTRLLDLILADVVALPDLSPELISCIRQLVELNMHMEAGMLLAQRNGINSALHTLDLASALLHRFCKLHKF
jgi:hypothetical protein